MPLYLGFDPGGNIGCALIRTGPRIAGERVSIKSCCSVDSAMGWFERERGGEEPQAAGIDTLLYWEGGEHGWREPDRRLVQQYPNAKLSVVSSNSLFGAMAVQGMLLAFRLRALWPAIVLNETHPKVLFHACCERRRSYPHAVRQGKKKVAYNWDLDPDEMRSWLGDQIAESVHIDKATRDVTNGDEWDALISAWATHQGCTGVWKEDLMPGESGGNWPAGPAHYYWPEAVPALDRSDTEGGAALRACLSPGKSK
jgi:hypothetical protein